MFLKFNSREYCVLYLYCFDGVVIASHALQPFKIYCAPPNLDITWMRM